MSKPVFDSINGEISRTYTFIKDGGYYVEVTIKSPTLLNVSKSGGHRVIDAEGASHYIPSGWVHLRWTTKDGHEKYPL